MKNPRVSYRIKRDGYEQQIEIQIDLIDIEKLGLLNYLLEHSIIDAVDTYSVVSRFVLLPTKEKENKKINLKQKNTGDTILSKVGPKEFRVHLHSNDYFQKNADKFPKYVDVVALTKGKALMQAMNKVGITDFPDNWNSIKTEPFMTVKDFGKYSMGDENNIYLKKVREEKQQQEEVNKV